MVSILVATCAPQPSPSSDDSIVELAAFAQFQTGNLTTDFLSLPEGLGLAAIDYGWLLLGESGAEDASLTVSGKAGRLQVFSADGDLEELELEISLGNSTQKQNVAVQVRFNNKRLDRLHPTPEWSSYRIPIPAELVRRGINIVSVAPRTGNRRDNADSQIQIRLRRARFRSRSGRPMWLARPQQIKIGDSIEMPIASLVDVAVEIPAAAHLRGSFEFEAAEGPATPGYAYIQLLDDSQSERTLFHRRFYRSTHRKGKVDLDLSRWSGQLVRLRLGTTGERNGVFRWHGLRLSSSETTAGRPEIPPIDLQTPPSSGVLGKPDVLVILLDAARADAFAPWGGPHPTPAAERLAKNGTVFSQAISPAPWTGQSVPSILTGLFPDTLGVGPWGSRLPDSVSTMSDHLAGAGYRTVLWSQHPFYTNHDSFRRGFQEFYRSPKGAYQVLPTADQLIAADKPTFAFVHLIPPHAPYQPPEPFRGAYSGWYTGEMSVDAKHLNSYPRHEDVESLTEDDRRYALDRYLENAAFADDLVGKILATLDGAGRYDESLIVLLSDHGEAFMEHGRFLHTSSVHHEFLHVPFIIKWPESVSFSSKRLNQAVSLIDLLPTLMDGLGIHSGDLGFQGRTLLPAALHDQPANRPIYAMTRGGHDPMRAPRTSLMLDTDGWRILLDPDENGIELYRSDVDPLETVDLAADYPLQAGLLRQLVLSQWYSNRGLFEPGELSGEPEALDEELMEQLEALGYLN